MYSDTITLFNRYTTSNGDIWYPTVLQDVNLNMDKSAIIAKYGAESQDNAALNVKNHFLGTKKMIGDKMWLPPKEWSRQPSDMLASTITFASGKEFDFFYQGEWESTDPVNDESYKNGFYNYMRNQYDYVFAITAVGMYSTIPHFEILAK